jgi:predicted DNA repair protein MutK
VLESSLALQILTVSVVSILATVGVYGIVALVVRMDDLGFMLIAKSNQKGFLNQLGVFLVKTLPVIIKIFAVVGTIALLLVSGGIFSHNIDYLHHVMPEWPSFIKEFTFGVIGGLFFLGLLAVGKKVLGMFR